MEQDKIQNNKINIPTWKNSRGVQELTELFTDPNKESPNIFSDFIEKIQDKKTENYLTKTDEKIKILDLGSGEGNLLEDLINYYKVKGIGISKYPERENNPEYNNKTMKGEYIHMELKEKLPDSIKNNSIDFITSFFSLQYIPDAPKILQDIYRKLKPNGESLISFGIPANISFSLVNSIVDNNKESIENHIINGIQIFKIKKGKENTELIIPNYSREINKDVGKDERPEQYHMDYEKWFVHTDGKRGDTHFTKKHDLLEEKTYSFKPIKDKGNEYSK